MISEKQCRLTEKGSQVLEEAIRKQGKTDSALARDSGIYRGTVAKIRDRKKAVTRRNIYDLFSCLDLDLEKDHCESFTCSSLKLPPEYDRLLELLEPLDRSTLTKAYRDSCPKGYNRSIPKAIETMVSNLRSLGQEGQPCFQKFVSLLATEVPELKVWGQKHIPNFAALISTSASKQQSEPVFYLMMLVKKSPQQRDRYIVEACLVEDPNPDDLEGETIPTKLTAGTSETTVFSVEELPSLLAQLVALVCCDHGIAPLELMIQCFLPTHLLHMPLDQSIVNIGPIEEVLGTWFKAVVVRATERQTPVYRVAENDWKKRWRHLICCWEVAHPEEWILQATDFVQFCNDLEGSLRNQSTLGCGFIGLAASSSHHEDLFCKIFATGFAIAFWLRPDHTAADPYLVFQSLLDGCVRELPMRLTQKRRTDPHCTGQPITLLWDNPFRPFPTLPFHSPLADPKSA